jgi:hypothetical protein
MIVNETMVRANGSVDVDIPTDQKWLGKAMEDKEVHTVLRLISKGNDDWVGLARIKDVIEFNVDSERKIKQLGWATDTELIEFRRAANNPSISGDDSRHGSDTRGLVIPDNPMTLEQAKSLINRIVHAWINSRMQ